MVEPTPSSSSVARSPAAAPRCVAPAGHVRASRKSAQARPDASSWLRIGQGVEKGSGCPDGKVARKREHVLVGRDEDGACALGQGGQVVVAGVAGAAAGRAPRSRRGQGAPRTRPPRPRARCCGSSGRRELARPRRAAGRRRRARRRRQASGRRAGPGRRPGGAGRRPGCSGRGRRALSAAGASCAGLRPRARPPRGRTESGDGLARVSVRRAR